MTVGRTAYAPIVRVRAGHLMCRPHHRHRHRNPVPDCQENEECVPIYRRTVVREVVVGTAVREAAETDDRSARELLCL